MSPVRGNGQIEGLGHVSDLEKSGHSTAICDISLGKGDPARDDPLLELVKRMQIFAGRDRQSAVAYNSPVAFDIVRNGRLHHLPPAGLPAHRGSIPHPIRSLCTLRTRRHLRAGRDTSEQNLPQPRWVSCDRGAGASTWFCVLRYSDFSTKSLSARDSAPQTSPLRPASWRTLA